MLDIRRRQFITLLGGAAAAWPLAARSQQAAMPVVGYLFRGSLESTANIVAAFRKGLSEAGYVEGRNVSVEYRFADGQADRLPLMAADLVRRRVAVIAAPGGTATVLAAKAATAAIPIVFEIGSDPVEDGLVASFNRPGGNVTGVTAINGELNGKRLGLLCEVVPKAARIGVLIDPDSAFASKNWIADIQAAATVIGRQTEVLLAGTMRDVGAESLMQNRVDALLVAGSPVFMSLRSELATLAARHGVPAMYWDRPLTEAGGLMSYGANGADQFRLVGVYTGRILKGEKPADMPVVQPTKFELVVNLKAAKAIGLTIPESFLLRADEVIE
jgi:putative tryptophan/tyrosine transport system substrate-binding protein